MTRAPQFAVIAAVTVGLFASACVDNDASGQAALAAITQRKDVVARLRAGHDHAKRTAIDSAWQKEAKRNGTGWPISDVMQSPLSQQMEKAVRLSDGQIEQIMVFDAGGCLVAADHPTHDYDQSDEAKWALTIGAQKRGAVIESSDQAPRGRVIQSSKSVVDHTGAIIGAVTIRWCQTKGGCD